MKNSLLLLMFSIIALQLHGQVADDSQVETSHFTSFLEIHTGNEVTTDKGDIAGESDENAEAELVSKIFSKGNRKMELSYTVVPASVTHGGDIYLQVITFPIGESPFSIPVGVGAGFAQKTYNDEQLNGYPENTQLQQISARIISGISYTNPHGSITARFGYNYTMNKHEYGRMLPGLDDSNSMNSVRPKDISVSNNHRLHCEITAFKSFSKSKPNFGILAGVQYLAPMDGSGQDMFMVKAGIGF